MTYKQNKLPTLLAISVWPMALVEMNLALAKHGPLTTDPVRASAILFREVAEATDDALKMTIAKDPVHASGHRQAMLFELAQVIGVAAFMSLNLLREIAAEEKKATYGKSGEPNGE